MALCNELACRAVVVGDYKKWKCLKHASSRSITATCVLCNKHEYVSNSYKICYECRQLRKQEELRGIVEKADFVDELDCPREVLIDLVCRWHIVQDCNNLGLPDTINP